MWSHKLRPDNRQRPKERRSPASRCAQSKVPEPMSLYEDEDLGATPTEVAVGWSRGVQLMQSQMQLKKAAAKTTSNLVPGSAGSSSTSSFKPKQAAPILAPVINLKSKNKSEDPVPSFGGSKKSKKPVRDPDLTFRLQSG